jgi:hypothetical protein
VEDNVYWLIQPDGKLGIVADVLLNATMVIRSFVACVPNVTELDAAPAAET